MKKALLLIFNLLALLLVSCSEAKGGVESKIYINSDWKLCSSGEVALEGKQVSSLDYKPSNWLTVNIPTTVLSGLRQNGKYKDIYFSDNIENVDTKQFEQSWWYRKEFKVDEYNPAQFYELMFEGINYSANVWINGVQIASRGEVEGPFAMHKLDITQYIKENNIVAVEVFPPGKTDLTIGFVDWNPNTPDKNMGLWRGVQLISSYGVAVENIALTSDVDIENDRADVKIDAELKNLSNKRVKGVLKSKIEGGITLDIPYSLEPNQTKRFVADVDSYPQLRIENPRLWWPVNMGSPELYNAEFKLYAGDVLSFECNERFGIRKIEQYTFNYENSDELTDIIRGYKINGEKVLLRGGGWVDDMMLSDTKEKVRAQVEYIKHMNLNTIRLEGFWGNSKEIYEACDENGILLMIGLSCHWEWKGYCGREEHAYMNVETPEDIELVSKSYQDQVKWGMNNPSIILWVYASDKLPLPQFERALDKRIREYDSERMTLSTCKGRYPESHGFQSSEVSGNAGVKMLGPYEYVPPMYWYDDRMFGGAYGFNTETGPGSQIPPIESLRKMLAEEDLEKINGEGWQFHCGRNEFQTLSRFLHAFNQRYWEIDNAEKLAFDVQISNYEAIRAMFEAFELNRTESTTGIIQWMLNSAWPEMYWQLYDWYLNPNGAFFGTKTALQPLNLIYNYATGEVSWTNNTPADRELRAEVKMFDINSKEFFSKSINIDAKSFSVGELMKLSNEAPSQTYFLSMKLYDGKEVEVSNNFYWLSTKEDKMDYSKTTWVYSPQSEFASFKQLENYKNVLPKSRAKFKNVDGKVEVSVTLSNPSDKISFFSEMRIIDKKTGLNVLPVLWSDNYVSLLPNETRHITATLSGKSSDMEFIIKGFNLPQ